MTLQVILRGSEGERVREKEVPTTGATREGGKEREREREGGRGREGGREREREREEKGCLITCVTIGTRKTAYMYL